MLLRGFSCKVQAAVGDARNVFCNILRILERIVKQFLKVNRRECCNDHQKARHAAESWGDWHENGILNKLCHASGGVHKDRTSEFENMWFENQTSRTTMDTAEWRMWWKILPILLGQFNRFREEPNAKQRVKFDCISGQLKRFFMKQEGDADIETGQPRWVISFDEIVSVYPNVKELHFINEYMFDDRVLRKLINRIKKGLDESEYDEHHLEWIKKCKKIKSTQIEKVHFLYYDYQEEEKSGLPKGGP